MGDRAPRSLADRPDLTSQPSVHLLYVVPKDGPDHRLDRSGVLEASMLAMNQWMLDQTGGRRLRVDTFIDDDGDERVDVTFVELPHSAAFYASGDAFGSITSALEREGFNASAAQKRYVVYYEGPAESERICGTAYYPLQGRFAQWSLVFLGSVDECGARDFGNPVTGPGFSEVIALHEMMHNEGLVPLTAPHQCAIAIAHLCTAGVGGLARGLDPESYDLMFPYAGRPLAEKKLDIGNDDYFDHPFPTMSDLADSPFLTR